jgi:small subunit ribosomal protein S17e
MGTKQLRPRDQYFTHMPAEPQDIISIGNRLLEQYPESFSNKFEQNKQNVTQYTNVGSLRLRNRVAGYITRKQTET